MESRAGISVARKNSGGDDIFDGFLDNAAHRASAHFGVIAFVDEDLFGLGADGDGDFLRLESFVSRSDDEVQDLE